MHVSPASPAPATLPVSPTAPQPPAPPRAPHTHDDSLAPFPPASSAGTRPHHRAPCARSHPGAPDTAHPARSASSAWSAWPAWPAWSEGRGPDPAPRLLVCWHLADGTPCHESAASDAEALAFARDARDAAQTETAVYRLWCILPH